MINADRKTKSISPASLSKSPGYATHAKNKNKTSTQIIEINQILQEEI
ncbi:hypothetical protein [Anaerocolumna aminovalerica]